MSQKPKTILVVDDDEDMLKLLNKILSTAGYKVLLAQSPADARKFLAIDPPHLILSDLHMQPENGFQFIQSIRSQKQYALVPLLVLSALNDFKSVKKAIALGVNDYAIKPLQPQMLLRKIKKAFLNKDFAKWEVPLDEEILVEVLIDAEVVSIGEAGCHLTGPFKITPGKDIKIFTPEFTSLDLDKLIHKASLDHKTYLPGGLFKNDITFVGISESSSSKIRQLVSKRKY